MSNTKQKLPIYDGYSAEVTDIHLDKKEREIIVTIKAAGSVYVEEPKQYGFPQLMNAAAIAEGFNLVLKHGHHAVNAIKGQSDLRKLYEENKRLKDLLKDICNFENGERVLIKGYSYQKAINDDSFYTEIQKSVK